MLLEKTYTPVDFARMAWRRRWLIIVPFVAGLFATLVVSSQLPDLFQSEMLIQVVPQRVPDSFVQSTVTVRTADRINALSQQAMSRTELEELIETFDLYSEALNELPMQDVVDQMRDNVEVDVSLGGARGADAEGFFVRFAYPDAEIATQVTGRIGALFVDQNARDRGALAEGTNEFLESQLAEARVRLEAQESRLEAFRQRHAGRLPDQLDFNMQAMQNTQLQLQAHVESLARDRDRKLMLERLYNDAEVGSTRPDTPAAEPPSDAIGSEESLESVDAAVATGSAQQRLAVARTVLAGLERRLKPEHPDVVRTKRLIEDLENEVAEGPSGMPTVLTPQELAQRQRLQQMRAEIESLGRQITFKEAEEQRLQDVIRQYEQRIEAVPGVETEWIALSRDYATQQDAYTDLLSKSEQAKVAADLERRQVGEQFRVLDPPRVPLTPTSPDRIQISAIGTFASLFLGLALGALIEVRDSTFRTESEVIELLTLPVIAQVPYVESDADRRWKRIRRALASGGTGIAVIAGGYVFWTMELWRYVV